MDLEELPRFLSAEELTDELARCSYRPGWTMQILTDPFEGVFLYVTAPVPDAFQVDETAPLYVRTLIPPIPDAEYFAVWLHWRLEVMERHECLEFFRRDGAIWRDPHDVAEPRKPEPDRPQPITARPTRITIEPDQGVVFYRRSGDGVVIPPE